MDDVKLINITELKNEILTTCWNMECDSCEFLDESSNCIRDKCTYMISSEELGAIIEDCEVDNPSDDNQLDSMSRPYIMKSKGSNYFPY